MYTQCPGCKTVFRIDVARLRSAHGEVLCQRCHIVFNALGALSETVSEATSESPGNSALPPSLGPAETVATSRYEQEMRQDTVHGADGLPSFSADANRPVRRRVPERSVEAPPVEPEGSADSRFAGWGWGLGSTALLLLALGQLAVFEGPRLAQQEDLRAGLEWLCRPLRCSLPEFHQLDRIRIVDRALQAAPDDIDGFEFSLIMVNQARLPQAYPTLRLALTEVNGAPIAVRQFKPEEYLGSVRPGSMPVGQPVEVRLLLARPAREIGGFSFELI
ncbi:zinc-ribbon and DUF3426 domain-containing protein [Methylococcus sp. EFPC2]|uniref:zinc-ribbon and DUF3426 domain-containing protein n=1 Tax=Methylococcus sp. EFPC2 TaxID=2812648 RepID=UPI001966CEB5|nr:zinc-ribbon and DUF3426 domain-containing protein [Methylococcus sp. EFPC2]QSA96698.1 zinc-ribbon and DUF3426 domain-containing protein [Methylococcus sp. EFPC2]